MLISALIISFVGLAVKGDPGYCQDIGKKIFIVAIQLQNRKVVVPWSVVFVTNINNLIMNMGFGRGKMNYG